MWPLPRTISSKYNNYGMIFVITVSVVKGCAWLVKQEKCYLLMLPNSLAIIFDGRSLARIIAKDGMGAWLRHGISRGIEVRTCGNSRGQLKKKWYFQGVFKKNSYGISLGLCFWPCWNFQRVSHNFAEFPGVKACFLWNF